MIFERFIDKQSFTHTYLLADDQGLAMLIDPVYESIPGILAFLRQNRLELLYSIETHIHADHITGASMLREVTGCSLVISRHAVGSDYTRFVSEGDTLICGTLELSVYETPGHTPCSITLRWNDKLFTGDCLLIGGCGRTDFQNGSAAEQWKSLSRLMSYPDETLVYPAHDYHQRTVSTVGEERRTNPRWFGQNEESFVQLMRDLRLDPPKLLSQAVPRNLKAGKDTLDF